MLTAALFAAGIMLTAVVVAFFGFNEVIGVITTARADFIAVALVLQAVTMLSLGLRTHMLARKYGRISFLEAFRINMAGTTISMLTPIAKIGGEPLKIQMLRKRLTGSQATAVIAVDTLAELSSSLFIVLLVFLLFAKNVPSVIYSSFVVFLAFVIVVIFVMLKIFLTRTWLTKIVGWTTKRITRLSHIDRQDYAKLFYDAFRLLLRDKRIIVSVFGVSFFSKIVEFVRMWFVFLAIGVLLPWEIVLVLWAVILVLYLVPWLPGSLGLVEFFGAGTLIFFGLTSTTATGGLLIDRFISFWLFLFTGLLIIAATPVPKKLL